MKHIITQFSLAGALVSGYNHGDSYTITKLTKSSSFGLGAFNDLDGELVMRDSRVFCTKKTWINT